MTKKVVTEESLIEWLQTAQLGERLIYYIGNLGYDRVNAGSAAHRDRANRLGNLAWGFYAARKIWLVQKRRISGQMNYIAVMRHARLDSEQSWEQPQITVQAPVIIEQIALLTSAQSGVS